MLFTLKSNTGWRNGKRFKFLCLGPLAPLLLTSCQTYQLAQSVKLIGFDEDPTAGKGAGPVRGENCVWMVLGTWLGGPPTMDEALADARLKSGTLKYMTNVATTSDGFNLGGFVGKNCIHVRGNGYK